ncbi:helix-turn-helix domain-containing protein [Enterococcus faecium]|uniref:helix-turn-helix domain-containing protein n=1 Tax=Enterococcus faecium TaxID=1352 RepID=UPI003219EC61|nr:helix-turn-helix domain-containing protein [Enterococcus faecium]
MPRPRIIEEISYETGKIEKYEIIELMETVKVKNDEFEVLHEYYKRLSDGELFEPFDNPDKNLNKDYDLYRKKYSLLSAVEVKNIRRKYKLSIREFSEILGISYSNLSSIENGSLQANYIDTLLRLASDPYAFSKLINDKKDILSVNILEKLKPTLNELVLMSYEEHKELAEEVRKYHLDIRNNIISISNIIKFESKSTKKGDQEWLTLPSNKPKTVLKSFNLNWSR